MNKLIWLFPFLISLAPVISYGARPISSPPDYSYDPGAIQVVFDIDDTLVRQLRPNPDFFNLANLSKPDQFSILGDQYLLNHGAIEILAALKRKIPNVQISFFSAGMEIRNRVLVPKLVKQAEELLGETIPYQIFSRKHLKENKKDFEVLNPNFDPKKVVLIDDNCKWAAQPNNCIEVLSNSTFLFDMINLGKLRSFPKIATEIKVRLDSNLPIVLGKILNAAERTVDGEVEFLDALVPAIKDDVDQALSGTESNNLPMLVRRLVSFPDLFKQSQDPTGFELKGIEAMKEVNPAFRSRQRVTVGERKAREAVTPSMSRISI